MAITTAGDGIRTHDVFYSMVKNDGNVKADEEQNFERECAR
jgi:hypothetical protein